jgi:type I restriction enzyme S subunit
MSSEWPPQRFDQIAEINPTRKVRKGSEVQFVDMAALPQHARDISLAGVVTREAKGAGAHFQNGDTLLARITPCLENGKTAQVRCLDETAVGEGSTEFIVLCGKDSADNDYIYYLCREPEFREYAIGRMEGTSGRQRVSWQSIAAYEFSFPPPDERRSAARILSALDDRITLLRETNTTLEAIAKALFKSWFVDYDPVHAKMQGRDPEGMDEATAALFPDSFEDSELGPVPRGWQIESIYEIAKVIYGAPFASKQFKSDPSGKPLVRIRDLKDERPGVYTEEVHPKGYLLQPGDIAVGMDGEFRAYVWGGEEAWLNQRVCVFQPVNNANSVFLRLSIAPLLASVEASETATTVIHLGKNDIDRFKIAHPGDPLLLSFASITTPLYRCVVSNKQMIQNLAALRDTLLPRLISGQLRIEEAHEVVA